MKTKAITTKTARRQDLCSQYANAASPRTTTRNGMCRRMAVKPSTTKSIAAVTASKNPAALSCSQVIPILTQRPSGILGSVNQLSNAVPPTEALASPSISPPAFCPREREGPRLGVARLEAEALLHRLEAWLAVERRHPVEPGGELRRIGLQPFLGRLWPLVAVGEDLVHHQVLDVDSVDEVLDEPGRVRALGGEAGALIGVDDRAAEIRAEAVVAAGQVLDLKVDVHRMGRPTEEDHVLLVAGRPLYFGEHPLFARFDQLEVLEPELVPLDEVEDQAVAVVAGLDAEDLAVKRVLELLDVAEILEALVIGVLWDGQRVFRSDRQIGADHDHGLVLDIGLAVVLHRRLPVAEEHVDVLVLHRRVGHRNREDRGLGRIAETFEDFAGDRGRRGDVGPSDVGEPHRPAAFRVARERGAYARKPECARHCQNR